ncbi:MAG TPA: hypothetical protein DEH22_10310 [Chloroflexi bacterium]|nr:hypothetical protein [Chloroflexota bacterium]
MPLGQRGVDRHNLEVLTIFLQYGRQDFLNNLFTVGAGGRIEKQRPHGGLGAGVLGLCGDESEADNQH